MGSAYRWEAHRRQMALDQRRWLMAQQEQQQQQQQELKKLQEEESQSEKNRQPSQESGQVPQPSLVQSQPQAAQPQLPQRKKLLEQLLEQVPPPPPPQPSQQNAQAPLTQYTSKHALQDCQKSGPQLGSVGTHQAGGLSNYSNNKFQGGPKPPQNPSFRKSDQCSPDTPSTHD